MTLTNITNDNGEVIVGILEKKSKDQLILIVHGEQGTTTHYHCNNSSDRHID